MLAGVVAVAVRPESRTPQPHRYVHQKSTPPRPRTGLHRTSRRTAYFARILEATTLAASRAIEGVTCEYRSSVTPTVA